jgi:hypothetical protein
MLVKSDFAPAFTERHLIKQSQKTPVAILRQPVVKLALIAAQDLLTLFAIVSGLPDPLENLEEMGIYLGPTHA